MKSVIIHNWLKDPFTEISVSTSPTPNIENLPSNAVLVAVKHTALNFFDILLVKGQYQIRPPFPFVPGSEFSGIVIGVGKDIKQDQFKIGDAVFGSSPNGLGAYATHTIVPLDKSRPPTLYRLPPELTLKQGATLYYTYPTAWAGLFLRARLKENEVVLVHGGAGGVAVAAIQFAKSVPGVSFFLKISFLTNINFYKTFINQDQSHRNMSRRRRIDERKVFEGAIRRRCRFGLHRFRRKDERNA